MIRASVLGAPWDRNWQAGAAWSWPTATELYTSKPARGPFCVLWS